MKGIGPILEMISKCVTKLHFLRKKLAFV